MNAHLKLLADASLAVSAAEDDLGESAFHRAQDQLDSARETLAELRTRWPDMSAAERGVVGPAAQGVRARLDATAARVPRLSALTVGAPVVDPEQDQDPE